MMQLVNLFMQLQKYLDPESTAMTVNFLQHITQHPDPKAELKRLLTVLQPELAPKFRLQITSKT